MFMNLKFDMCHKAIVACCVLHNIIELSEGHPAGPDRYQKARAVDRVHGHGTVSMPDPLRADAHRANQPYDSTANDPDTDFDGGMRLLNDVTAYAHRLRRLRRSEVNRIHATL